VRVVKDDWLGHTPKRIPVPLRNDPLIGGHVADCDGTNYPACPGCFAIHWELLKK
jgi:hypothetical protein